MVNGHLQKLIDETIAAGQEHYRLLMQLEAEYKNRFGVFPSDVNDAFFIDTFHQTRSSGCTVEEMTNNAKLFISINKTTTK